MTEKIEYSLVRMACCGDKRALDEVIIRISDTIYNLSLRMLLFPEDAKDASQEILIKLITHLNDFKGESAFETWVFRIATNYLISLRSKNTERFRMSFEQYATMLDKGHSDAVSFAKNEGELKLLEEEVKISCTHGILLCLDPIDRVVYILGDIIGINSIDGAGILEITSENYRQILSRSRKRIRDFMRLKCGLVNESNSCRCAKKIDFLVERNLITPAKLKFADKDRSLHLIAFIEEIDKSLSIFRSIPNFKFPTDKYSEISQIINSIRIN